jgi:hypothetical protein
VGFLSDLKFWITSKNPGREDLAKRLEQEHKTTFVYLVDSTNFYLNLVKKFPKATRSAAQTKIISDYLLNGIKIADRWKAKQKELEEIGVKKYDPKFYSFIDQTAINKKAADMRSGISGTGSGDSDLGFPFVIPLLWFGAVAVGSWAVVKITDMLTTSAEEQESLLKTTTQAAKDLNLSPEQAAQLIKDQEAGVETSILPYSGKSSFGGGAIYVVGLIALLYYLYNKSEKSKS